jgi:putative lipoprotein
MTDDGADPSAEHPSPIGSWRATVIGGEVIPTEVEVTATFGDDGRVNGRGGCNRYSGSFTVTGSEMAFGPIMSTRMACIGEGGRIEGRYLAALDAVTGWTLASNTLTLAGPAGSDAIVYERLDPASTVAGEATVRSPTAGGPTGGEPAAGQPVDGED